MAKKRNERLEQQRQFLLSLTQSERDFIGQFGFDMFNKLKQHEQEQKEKRTLEISEAMQKKEIPITLTHESIEKLDSEIRIRRSELEDMEKEKIELQTEINALTIQTINLEEKLRRLKTEDTEFLRNKATLEEIARKYTVYLKRKKSQSTS